MKIKFLLITLFSTLYIDATTYSIEEVTKKISLGERTTIDEMQFYSFYLMANQGKTHVFANLFWIFFHLSNIIGTGILNALKPQIKNLIKGKNFKKNFKLITDETYSIEKIIGYEEQKNTCIKIINAMKKQKEDKKYKKNEGILFFGPPGCGKTHFAKTIAFESQLPIIYIKMTDLINEQGIVSNNIDILFKAIREYKQKNGTCIVFFDEFDFFVGNRKAGSLDQSAKIAVQNLLEQLESDNMKGVFFIACTNVKENIDEALLRTGRFGTHIAFNFPTEKDINYFYEKYKVNFLNFDKNEIQEKFKNKNISEILKIIKDIKDNE